MPAYDLQPANRNHENEACSNIYNSVLQTHPRYYQNQSHEILQHHPKDKPHSSYSPVKHQDRGQIHSESILDQNILYHQTHRHCTCPGLYTDQRPKRLVLVYQLLDHQHQNCSHYSHDLDHNYLFQDHFQEQN